MRARRPMIAPSVGDVGVVVNESGALTPVVVVCVYRRGMYQVMAKRDGKYRATKDGWLTRAPSRVKLPRDDEEAQMCRDFLEVRE